MSDADGYFGEPVAATYDESESAEFEPGIVATTVDVLAGLRLRERWDGWIGEPFTSQSRQHVSIWENPAADRESGRCTSKSGLSKV